MISFKIEGLHDLITDLQNVEGWLEPSEIDSIVQRAAMPLVQKIKEGYISGGHEKTGALVNSIEAFQSSRKKNDPYFTYYVGPRYTSRKGLISYGGNAAHLLEYGTVERHRADHAKGGMGKTYKRQSTGLSAVYGATNRTGKVQAYGVIRKAYDEYSQQGIEFMKVQILSLIKSSAQKIGKAA
jgi:hypothetical protein